MSHVETTTVAEHVTTGLPLARLQTPVVTLKRLLVATIRQDPACRTLLGIRNQMDDPRVYAYYSPTATVDVERPAYITYAQTGFPERYHATGDPILNCAVWGLSWEAVEAVRERLVALFDAKTLVTETGRPVHGVILLMHDNFQENTKFASIVVQIRLGFSQV